MGKEEEVDMYIDEIEIIPTTPQEIVAHLETPPSNYVNTKVFEVRAETVRTGRLKLNEEIRLVHGEAGAGRWR